MPNPKKPIEIPMDEMASVRQKVTLNGAVTSTVHAADSANIGFIFSTFYVTILESFMEHVGKYIFFPFAAAASLIVAALKWHQYYLDRNEHGQRKKNNLVQAIIETVAAIGVTTAVAFSIAATLIASVAVATVLAFMVPIIFTIVVGGKALLNAAAAVFYLGKATATYDPTQRSQYQTQAKNHAIGAAIGLVATAGVIAVFVLGKVVLAGLGIAAGIGGTIFAAVTAIKQFTAWKKQRAGYQPLDAEIQHEKPAADKKPTRTNNLDIHQRMQRTNSNASSYSASTASSVNSQGENRQRPDFLRSNASPRMYVPVNNKIPVSSVENTRLSKSLGG